jgi:hypothetical protein
MSSLLNNSKALIEMAVEKVFFKFSFGGSCSPMERLDVYWETGS